MIVYYVCILNVFCDTPSCAGLLEAAMSGRVQCCRIPTQGVMAFFPFGDQKYVLNCIFSLKYSILRLTVSVTIRTGFRMITNRIPILFSVLSHTVYMYHCST